MHTSQSSQIVQSCHHNVRIVQRRMTKSCCCCSTEFNVIKLSSVLFHTSLCLLHSEIQEKQLFCHTDWIINFRYHFIQSGILIPTVISKWSLIQVLSLVWHSFLWIAASFSEWYHLHDFFTNFSLIIFIQACHNLKILSDFKLSF